MYLRTVLGDTLQTQLEQELIRNAPSPHDGFSLSHTADKGLQVCRDRRALQAQTSSARRAGIPADASG